MQRGQAAVKEAMFVPRSGTGNGRNVGLPVFMV